MFLMPDINLKLRPQILDLKPGTRVVSNSFTMEEWTADETATMDDKRTAASITRPISGLCRQKWKARGNFRKANSRSSRPFRCFPERSNPAPIPCPVMNGKLSGDLINFNAGNAKYTARVSSGTMQGTFEGGGGATPWSATRK